MRSVSIVSPSRCPTRVLRRVFYGFLASLYYRRVKLVYPECLPRGAGPILYLGLHRNGAVDGFFTAHCCRGPSS